MYDEPTRQVNRKIAEALTSLQLIVLPNRKTTLDQFKNPDWVERLTVLFPIRGRSRCTQVLDLYTPILSQLCPSTPEEG